MFTHLPVITQGSFDVMGEKELLHFYEELKKCIEGAESPGEAIDRLLYEVKDSNPLLVKAVKGVLVSVAGELEGKVEAGLEWRAGMTAVFSVLATLRLIERELEARELGLRLGK